MWTADIGLWERGKNIDLSDVSNLEGALIKASEICAKTDFNDLKIENPFVIQVFNDEGKVVWDHMNGEYAAPDLV